MRLKLNSKAERSEILRSVTKHLIEIKCTDLALLREIDRLCRRTWIDIDRGWILWAYYLERLLGKEDYEVWAISNCKAVEALD